MKSKSWLCALGLLVAVAISMAQAGCNAQQAAYSLFTRQGLNLLRPARDYIQPGGMVFVPKHGNAEYEDPKDDVAPEKGTLTDFRASILDETANKRAGLGAALTLATTIIPMPISAGAQSSKQVSLKQIDTTGVRLSTKALDQLIAAPNTSKAAAAELQKRNGMRVFVVQEIYTATSLDLHAEDNKAFNLNFNDGKAVADCKQGDQSTGKSDTGTDKKDASAANPKGGSTADAAAKAAGKGGTAKDKTSSQAKPAGASSTTQSKLGAGLAFCLADDYTLKLQTKDPIPFAVRLAELEMSGGTVQRNRGTILKGTLGGDEISAALTSKEKPVIDRLVRRPKAQK
jgi:hypothetical protein